MAMGGCRQQLEAHGSGRCCCCTSHSAQGLSLRKWREGDEAQQQWEPYAAPIRASCLSNNQRRHTAAPQPSNVHKCFPSALRPTSTSQLHTHARPACVHAHPLLRALQHTHNTSLLPVITANDHWFTKGTVHPFPCDHPCGFPVLPPPCAAVLPPTLCCPPLSGCGCG